MRSRTFVPTVALVCLVLAGVVSSWASDHPDGLERVASDHGFAHSAGTSLTAGSPLAGYPDGWAGVAGCVLVFLLLWGVTRVTARLHAGNTRWK